MSICVVDGKSCRCQPTEGFPCPGVVEMRAEIERLRAALDDATARLIEWRLRGIAGLASSSARITAACKGKAS